MTDWIEIPKKVPTSGLKPDAVTFSLAPMARSIFVARLAIGSAILAKLQWTAETALRIRWAADASKVKIDVAPPNHPHVYKLRLSKAGAGMIRAAALPATLPREMVKAVPVAHEVLADRSVKAVSELVVTLPAAAAKKSKAA